MKRGIGMCFLVPNLNLNCTNEWIFYLILGVQTATWAPDVNTKTWMARI